MIVRNALLAISLLSIGATLYAQENHKPKKEQQNLLSRGIFFEDGANYILMEAPTGMTSSYSMLLPPDAPGTNQVLQAADGSGNLQWGSVASDPTSTLGDIIFRGSSALESLSGATSPASTRQFLTSTPTGSTANAPAWNTISAGDLPAASASSAGTVSSESSGTFSVSFTGPRSMSQTWSYYRVGKMVTLHWPSNSATACTTADHFTASFPMAQSDLIPSTNLSFPVFVSNGGNAQDIPGQIILDSSGNITLYKSNSTLNFTGSGNCGIYFGTITYTVY